MRCLTFNPDGRTLLCGLHESLKVRAFVLFHMIGTISLCLLRLLQLYRFSLGNRVDAMMLWMWDGLDYRILMFMRESFLAARTIRVVLEYGL